MGAGRGPRLNEPDGAACRTAPEQPAKQQDQADAHEQRDE